MHTKVFLVPGFFGFSSIHGLTYFQGVAEILTEVLTARGLDAEVLHCETLPTASIKRRALRVLEQVEARGGFEAEAIHFIGHSTGGLDVRLLVTPGVKLLEKDQREELLGQRVRSVVSVSTPHYGTPLASFFATVQGRQILEVLAILATSEPGRFALLGLSKVLRLVAKADDPLGRRSTILDQLVNRVLKQVDRESELFDLLQSIAEDQGAIIQLMPEAMDLFQAAVTDRPGVRYGSVLTAAPPPFAHAIGERVNPESAAMVLLYGMLHKFSARVNHNYANQEISAAEIDQLQARLPFEVSAQSSDGVVPLFSQLHGDKVDVVLADHLDIVGQFKGHKGRRLDDWLPSGAHFTRQRFEAAWTTIGDWIAAGEG